MVGAGDANLLARFVQQFHLRAQALARGGAALGIDHDERREARPLVDLLGDGDAFLDVLETHDAAVLGDDRAGMRVPRGERLPRLDGLAVGCQERRAVGHLVTLALAAVVVGDEHFAGPGDHHLLALGVGDVAYLRRETHGAVRLRFDLVRRGGARGRSSDVEGAHGELGSRLADRLRRDHADRLADVDGGTARKVASIAGGTQAPARVAGERRAHPHFVDAERLDVLDLVFVQERRGVVEHFLGFRVEQIGGRDPAENALSQRFDDFAPFDQRFHGNAVRGAAVLFRDHEILGHVHQAPRQMPRVRRLQGGVGEALARAVRRDEVLQHVQPFAEVGGDRRLDDRAVGLGHQAAHAGKLPDLGRGAAGAGVGHHVDGVERLLLDPLALAVGDVLRGELVHHRLPDLVAGAAPDVNDLVVTLAHRHQARGVLGLDFLHFGFGRGDEIVLLNGHEHVVDADRNTRARRDGEARLHELVGENHRFAQSATAERRVDEFGDLLFLERLVDQFKGQAHGKNFRKQGAADRGPVPHEPFDRFSARHELGLADAHRDPRVQLGLPGVVRAGPFGHIGEHHGFAPGIDALARGVVKPQNDVLRGHDDRVTVRGRKDVVRGEHQRPRLHLSFERQRHVHGHLVAVEVGVERRAHQRVQLDRLALDQHRLEGLDAEAVQGRRAIQHHRVLADHLFEDVPHDGRLGLDLALRGLDGRGDALHLELVEDEGFEQFERHLLGQAALVQLQLRAHHDHRASRVVHALAEQVLTEAPALALDHVGERLQGALVGAGHRLAAAAVVQQRVDRFLEHSLFIPDDDLGRFQLEQPLQPVVAVDHAAVQVVQIGGRETPAVERDQGPQLGGQHRQHFHDHPVRLDAGFLEAFEHFETLGELLDLGVGAGALELLPQSIDLLVEVDRAQQLANALGSHGGREIVSVLLDLGEVILLGEELRPLDLLVVDHARVGDDIGLEVEDALDVSERHVEHQPQARGQALQEPDVRHGAGELDMPHALATDLGERHLDAALLADHAAVLQALVLSAQAFVVLDGPEDLGAEEAVPLRLEGAVVDRFGFLHFAVGPRADLFRRGDPDLDRVELLFLRNLLEQIEQCFHVLLLYQTFTDTWRKGAECRKVQSFSKTLQVDVDAQRPDFLHQHVEGLRHSRVDLVVALDDVFVDLGAAVDVVGFDREHLLQRVRGAVGFEGPDFHLAESDRKSTRLNSSHSQISYAVFCLKKKKHGRRSVAASTLACL